MKFISNTVVVAYLMALAVVVVESAKVKRVKAGMKYKEKDPVHVVVNKVG